MFFAIYGGMHGVWAPAMVALTVLGSGWSVAPILALVGWARTRRLALPLLVAIAFQATLVWWLKRVCGRVRPWLALGLPPPIGAPHDGSFPSGHAAGAFCVAAFLVVALRVTRRGRPLHASVLAAGFGVLASLIALSRVYLGAHFPSDVASGATLGALVGGGVAALCFGRERRAKGAVGGQGWMALRKDGKRGPPCETDPS